MLMRNPSGLKITQPGILEFDEYGKYDELCRKIHYKFRLKFELIM